MKAIAIIEIPDGGKGKWFIDGYIRYTEDESLMKKFDADMIPLKPLPSHMELESNDTRTKAIKIDNSFRMGWNMCLGEILGENK